MITIQAKIDGGQNIEHAFSEAKRISTILHCWVEFEFNGVTCTIDPKGIVDRGVSNYHTAIKDKTNFAIG